MNSNSHENEFLERKKESDWWTNELVLQLLETGHISDFRKATPDEDKNELIDYWFLYPKKKEFEPVAFKLRTDPRKRDIPVLRYQPFHGIDNVKTKEGRDFKCVLFSSIVNYYVGVKEHPDYYDEIYRITKKKLRPLVSKADQDWDSDEKGLIGAVAKKMLTIEKHNFFLKNKKFEMIWVTDNVEVWWQKPKRNEAAKVNFYLPESLKEESFEIPEKVGIDMSLRYKKWKNDTEGAEYEMA